MAALEIEYESRGRWHSLSAEDQGGDRTILRGPFGSLTAVEIPGRLSYYYFYSVIVRQSVKLNIRLRPDCLYLIFSEQGAFLHCWNRHPRRLAKSLGDIFYQPENKVLLDFDEPGYCHFSLLELAYELIQPLQALNASLQLLAGAIGRKHAICLSAIPLVLNLSARIELENIRADQRNRPLPEIFVDNQCLMIFLNIIEKRALSNSSSSCKSPVNDDQEKLEQAAEEIMMAPDRRIQLKKLAWKYQMSPGRLRALFKRRFGMNIHQYLLNIRLQRATYLIHHTACSIHEIAAELGYASNSTFSALYKRKTGVSPSHLRKMKSLPSSAEKIV